MSALRLAFLIVAVILFALAAIPVASTRTWHPGLVAAGLAFFAAAFAVPG